MKMRTGMKYAGFAFGICLLVLGGIHLATACGHSADPVDNRIAADLNASLSNEMSEREGFEGFDRKITAYMQEWGLQGVSLSVMRNDSLLLAKGYGWADKREEIKMQPGHILRMASVSKLITATGIMVLQEAGKLSLSDTVFGPSGILRDSVFTEVIKDRNYFKITVEDLLRHKGGFLVTGGDPMFSTRTVMLQNHLRTPPDNKRLLRICLRKTLGYEPGTTQAYSNLGYMILSLVIEKVSGMSYEDFIRLEVLEKARCYDMHLAHNYYKDRYPNEVRYYVPVNEKPVPEYNNSGKMVTRCYGGNDIRALSGAGAWVGSTPELARFVASIDGKPSVPDILTPQSVEAMTEWFDPDTFSLGWNDTKPTGEWTRTGTFSGTTALVKYFPEGDCWIFIANTSTWKGPSFSKKTEALIRELRPLYNPLFPRRDLFWEKETDE